MVYVGALRREALLRKNEAGEKLPVALACDHGLTKALQACTVRSSETDVEDLFISQRKNIKFYR